MGYSERWCQLCGVSFNVGRIRTGDEPLEAAWQNTGDGVVEEDDCNCEADGCSNVVTKLPEHVYHDGSVHQPEEVREHIAGPACTSTSGYSGHRISVEEMKECTWVQCLMSKTQGWSPEPDDEAFELAAELAWLTGTSKGPPDEFDLHNIIPERHGVSETAINNGGDPDTSWGTPMHPYCFHIFKQESTRHFGKVHIDGLRRIWLDNDDYERFPGMPKSLDLERVSEQMYDCIPGTEYLVTHPIHVPGLQDLIHSCVDSRKVAPEVFSTSSPNARHGWDPFAVLSPELKLMIMLQLNRQDLATLRLASRSFQQLHQVYFHQLVLSEMPWVLADIEDLPAGEVDWHKLWCKLSAADGGSQEDEAERAWLGYTAYPSIFWNQLCDIMTLEERERLGIDSMKSDQHNITDKQRKKVEAITMERRKTRQQWPKETELKGLRNRRRIYGDVQSFLKRIDELEGEAEESHTNMD